MRSVRTLNMAKKTVSIVELGTGDPSVEKIDFSEELRELLINSPIGGRSDYRGKIILNVRIECR